VSGAVVVVTYERPDHLLVCLEHLERQSRQPDEVVVVDSSRDDRTSELVSTFPTVRYLRNPNGYGHMTQSRNLGYRVTSSDIVAYVDDDAFARDNWFETLMEAFDAPTVGAAGGRALNDQPDEGRVGVDAIGRLLPNGLLTGNFAADPGGRIDVDHVIGCNMAYRRSVLDLLDGFREDFPGTALREDTDMSLRVGRAGYRLVFEPRAVVRHVGAPHPKGQRFDLRYAYYGQRNHVAMLIANFGGAAPIVRRFIITGTRLEFAASARRVASGVLRLLAHLAGTTTGLMAGFRLRRSDAICHTPQQ